MDSNEHNKKLLAGLIDKLARTSETGIGSYFTEVKTDIEVKETKALSHCYFLNMDGNGRPRTKDLAEFVILHLVDYSIPRKEITEARRKNLENNTEIYTQELAQKARGLFASVKKSGEWGEMLLYVLVQEILKLPQLISKMPLKTNSNVHYHGVDGIHVSVDENPNGEEMLSLHWGESKLYKNLGTALKQCMESINGFLLSEDGSGSGADRDLQLIQDNLSIEDESIKTALLRYLDKKDPLYNKVNYKAVCLVGFDYGCYPTDPNSGKTKDEIKAEIEAVLEDWTGKVKEKISDHPKLNTFDIHVFLIPFPSVEDFRKAFLVELGINKDHDTGD